MSRPSGGGLSHLKQKRHGEKKTFSYPAEGILPPCKVCGDKASGYHFGAVSCEACKVFFHRSLDRDKDYRCKTKTKKCEVSYMKKPICAYCRLAKCFQLGMSKDGVKRGRYSLQTRTEHILEAKASDSSSCSEASPGSSYDGVMSEERKQYLQQLLDDVTKVAVDNSLYSPEMIASIPQRHVEASERLKMEEKLFGGMITLDVYKDIKSVTGVEIDDRKQRLKKCLVNLDSEFYLYINVFRSLPGFMKLHHEDRVTLTKDNRFKWNVLANLPGIDTENKFYTCASCEQSFHMSEMEIYFNCDYVHEKFRIGKMFKALNMTDTERAMIGAISLLSTDNIEDDIKDQTTLDELTEDYIDALVFHVNNTRPTEEQMIAKMIHRLTELRTSNHLYARVMCSFQEDFPDIQVSELFKELKICNGK